MLSSCYASFLFMDHFFITLLLSTGHCILQRDITLLYTSWRTIPFLTHCNPIPIAQLVYKAPVDTLYLLTLNLLCIPFPLLLTHSQALSLTLQPELLGCNTNFSTDPSLWDGNFSSISLFGNKEFFLHDATNIICSLHKMATFIR